MRIRVDQARVATPGLPREQVADEDSLGNLVPGGQWETIQETQRELMQVVMPCLHAPAADLTEAVRRRKCVSSL